MCPWVCCRRAGTGDPWWVPQELGYLFLRPGDRHRLGPSVSTGLACGRVGDPVLLRGLQEVIERDAVVGAWWGSYAVGEYPEAEVLTALGANRAARLRRPNLRYRFFRVASPYSAHVTLVTLEGEDREGYCFSAGSACRETQPIGSSGRPARRPTSCSSPETARVDQIRWTKSFTDSRMRRACRC